MCLDTLAARRLRGTCFRIELEGRVDWSSIRRSVELEELEVVECFELVVDFYELYVEAVVSRFSFPWVLIVRPPVDWFCRGR